MTATAIYTRYNTPEEYLAYLKGVSQDYIPRGDDDFYGMPYTQAIDHLEHAKPHGYLAEAQKLIDKMRDANVFAQNKLEITNDVVGFMPNVPAYRAGQPNHMFRRTQSENNSLTTPINIYVETLVSASVSQDELIKRGIAVCALTLALNSIRPVELWTVLIGDPNHMCRSAGAVVAIPSKPLDLERATWMLCDPAYYRRMAFAAMHEHAREHHRGSTGWPFNSSPRERNYEARAREAIGLEPDDIFIKGGHVSDGLMLSDPVQWVRNEVAKHNGQGDTE